MNRAYSALHVKNVTERDGFVRIKGVASTPRMDRDGDILNPMGAKFTTPMPLLWMHKADKPVGHVTFAKPGPNGIPFEAEIPVIKEPGALKDRVDEAIQSLRYKLVAFVSVGFRPVVDAVKRLSGGGLQFDEWDWHELSLVTIPAQPDALISGVKSLREDDENVDPLSQEVIAVLKSIDTQSRAALGQHGIKAVRLISAGASANAAPNPKPKPQEGNDVKTIKEQIEALQATRTAKSARMEEVMNKSIEEGRSTDQAEAEEFDTLEGEVAQLDKDLARLKKLEAVNKAAATPAAGGDPAAAAAARAGTHVLALKPKLEKGIEFARFTMCLASAKGNIPHAYEIAKSRFADSPELHTVLKAAVAAGTTTDPTWAGPLVEYNQFAGDFVDYLRPRTIIGRFGQDGIPELRRIPFNVHIRGQTSGGAGYWVGQGAPKPVTKFDFNDTYLGWAKVANIAVLTEDLVRFSNPSAERLVRDALAGALIERLDIDFVDPAKAAVANVSPASITNGVTPITSSGNAAEDVRTDVAAAMGRFITANISPTTAVWIMSAQRALALSLMRNALGQKEYPEMTMMGGRFEGLPVIVSEYLSQLADSSGDIVILANASDIWLADDGQVAIDASREASLQMLDNPTNNSSTATPTTMVSMFQTNSIAIRAERWINWAKRRAAAVVVIEGVNWGVAT